MMTPTPSNTELLLKIQRLQFSDRVRAEGQLLPFLCKSLGLNIAKVELNVKAESLNSLNGFITLESGERYFFKSHVEENEGSVGEYYNARVLADAGYPVITPKSVLESPGQQIAVYEIISSPTLFDEVKAEEDKILLGAPSTKGAELITAQEILDDTILRIYTKTREKSETAAVTQPAIYQLFTERLKESGRLGLFYKGKSVSLDGKAYSFGEMSTLRWKINGAEYPETISTLIAHAQRVLDPSIPSPTIVGHGDAHNGNVFNTAEGLRYFDPAFAGRHNPLLDLTKPLFHNVFARWMYFPEEVVKEIELSYSIRDGYIEVNHSFVPSSLRESFLKSKVDRVLKPLVGDETLFFGWKEYLHSSLLCCPLLTTDLFAKYQSDGNLAQRYPTVIKVLGLCMAVESASRPTSGTNKISQLFSTVFD